VGVVDGTTLSLPDTAANQAVWPQHRGQKPECGFPILKLVGLFSLATGAAHALVTGTLPNAEQALFPHLWNSLALEVDLLRGDHWRCGWAAISVSWAQAVSAAPANKPPIEFDRQGRLVPRLRPDLAKNQKRSPENGCEAIFRALMKCILNPCTKTPRSDPDLEDEVVGASRVRGIGF
jgi:hypothetical protein